MPSKSYIIFSTIKLYRGNTAGSARMLNFARSLAKKNAVYLFSFFDTMGSNGKTIALKEVEKGIFVVGGKSFRGNRYFQKLAYLFKLMFFVYRMESFAEQIRRECVFYLYPSTFVLLDYIAIIYLVFIKRHRVYCDINEVRRYSSNFEERIDLLRHPFDYIKVRFQYIKYAIAERLTKYYSGLVCISTNIERYFQRYNNNTIRVPILSDASLINYSSPPVYQKSDRFLMCFAGSVSVKKERLDTFLEALAILNNRFSNFEFHMYGKITERDNTHIFNELVPKFKLQGKIIYKGFVRQDELPTIFRKYHLLIMARGFSWQNHYGFSTKLSEYFVSGVPVLLTKVSDNPLYVTDNYNGFIVEPDNEQILADKMYEIIENYNNLVDKVVDNAYLIVKRNFDYRLYSQALEKFLC